VTRPVSRSTPKSVREFLFLSVFVHFRMIHEASGKPINYLKGVETERGFKEVPEEEIIKGYEHTKAFRQPAFQPTIFLAVGRGARAF
jgi:hypothetical protein